MIILIILILLILVLYMSLVQAKLAINLVIEQDFEENKSYRSKVILKHLKNKNRFNISIEIFKLIFLMLLAYIFFNLYLTFTNLFWLFVFVYFFIVIIFGQITAEKFAYLNPKKTLFIIILHVDLLVYIITPIYYLFYYISLLINKIFHLKPGINDISLTEEHIKNIIEESSKTGQILEEEGEMIQNIFEFGDTTVDDVMTHRTEVSALNVDSSKDEVISFIKNEQYTRFPVYQKDVDHIIGTIHIKDILAVLDEDDNKFSLNNIIRKPYFVPSSKKTKDLFSEMQKNKNHIAIVLDEYGGTLGIVTIEDLIEEIVGNIFDEYDLEEQEIKKIKDDTYIVSGITNIYDLEDIIKADLPVEEYDTISGFILGLTGRLIKEDEKLVISYNNYTFEVLEVKDNVIKKIKIKKVIENE